MIQTSQSISLSKKYAVLIGATSKQMSMMCIVNFSKFSFLVQLMVSKNQSYIKTTETI